MVKATQIKVFYNELSNEKRQKDSSLGCKVVIILFLMLKHGDCSGLENSGNYLTGQSSNPQQSGAANIQSSIQHEDSEVKLVIKYNNTSIKLMCRLHSETLSDLKTKISKRKGLPRDTDHILLVFNDQFLRGDNVLSYYQITKESTLTVPMYKSTFVDVTIHYANIKSTKYIFHIKIVPEYHTVSDLKEIISNYKKNLAPVREQRLYFFPNNVEVLLDDSNENTLASYGIEKGSEIKLFVSDLF